MCKTKMAINATSPTSTPRTPSTTSSTARASATSLTFSDQNPSTSYASTSASTGYRLSSSNSISTSSRNSLPTLRETLPENPHIYDFSEIRAATNNFLSKRHSSSTPCWRCTLRGADVIVFQRKLRRKINDLRSLLSIICRCHHVNIVKLLGASISGDHVYLVYDFVAGGNLADCLRNARNANFTVLSTWMSRMQVATDLAHALDYVHNKNGVSIDFVHNHIKSSAIIVTEPDFNARVCHFGAAQLCGEVENQFATAGEKLGEIVEESPPARRSGRPEVQFSGVRGYMSPEYQTTGVATQESDVYAFGVVLLELLSGEEPLKFRFDEKTRDFVRISVVETARVAVDGGGGGGVRRWVDRRLKDSFPIDIADKLTRVALDCVHVEADKRPNMSRVADKVSTLYLKSKNWSESIKMPDMSVSLVPR
ncbi:lysM domain receptor-like kinase 3 [Lotus japonicus]|uniref:lysM domain receptor-like kinase 3 n=1 Tax=Lotus japonicus TaxID=34305 RepID=UPI00258A5DE8|nr:lysM domain receptor-like kinase 3 [Lotus japonicus]